MKLAKTNNVAIEQLLTWAAEDPSYRRFEVEWKGPYTASGWKWKGGWRVRLHSSRIKNYWMHYQESSLRLAVFRAIKGFPKPRSRK